MHILSYGNAAFIKSNSLASCNLNSIIESNHFFLRTYSMPTYFMEAPLFHQRALGMTMLLIAPTEHRFINKNDKESKTDVGIEHVLKLKSNFGPVESYGWSHNAQMAYVLYCNLGAHLCLKTCYFLHESIHLSVAATCPYHATWRPWFGLL